VSLISPKKEEHLELEPVIQVVEKNPCGEIIRTSFLQGFMNSASQNFSKTGVSNFRDWLVD
jgi:hypothetical protein